MSESSHRVAVVTDSTASLPAGVAASYGIRVVPVSVVLGETAYDEGSISPARIAQVLKDGSAAVTTSRPSPELFAEVYRVAASYGAKRIVSAHLPQGLSGTYESAVLASKHAPVPVTVIDTATTGMALGYAACAGAHFAQQGMDADAVASMVRDTASQSFLGLYVDSLEYLRRGGRVSAARAFVATALKVHPLLAMSVTGEVQVVERVRTRSRALDHLVNRAVSAMGEQGRVDVALHVVPTGQTGSASAGTPMSTDALGLADPDVVAEVERLGALLRERLGERIRSFQVVPLSAALAAHVGPGALSIAAAPVLSS